MVEWLALLLRYLKVVSSNLACGCCAIFCVSVNWEENGNLLLGARGLLDDIHTYTHTHIAFS
jgi:hypothetical protein